MRDFASSPLLDFVATSSASCLANLVTHPFENIKTRQQMAARVSSAHLICQVVRSEGVSALYRGLNAGLIRAVISGGGRLAIYNQLKLLLLNSEPRPGRIHIPEVWHPLARVSLGMLSGVLAAMVAAPIDMVRTCQVLQSRPDHRPTIAGILRDVIRKDGLAAIYRGSSALFVRQAIFTATQLATYDQAKFFLCHRLGSRLDSYPSIMGASLISGVASTATTAPLEMIKTHMQVRTGVSFQQAVHSIFRQKGIAGFWTGSLALYMKLAPHTFIVLVATEQFRQIFDVRQV